MDPIQVLGTKIGQEMHLAFKWPDETVQVHCRIVARMNHKQHLKFLNLPKIRTEELRHVLAVGASGLDVRAVMKSVEHGPSMDAREMWSSLQGNNVIIEDHAHRLAQITLNGISFILYKNTWPVKDAATPLNRDELAKLILFLHNIPQPSEALGALIANLETMCSRGAE